MNTNVIESRCWSVRVTLPKDGSSGRSWAVNKSISVIAPTIERVIATVLAKWPDAAIFGIQHRGESEVLIDNVGVVFPPAAEVRRG